MPFEDEVNNLLLQQQSGAPPFQYETPGDTCEGRVTDFVMRQSYKYQTTDLDAWPDGNPKMELVITVDTGDHGGQDTTERRLFAKKGGNMWKALQEAIRESGGKFCNDGTLKMRYTGDGEAKTKGYKPPKLYKAKWVAPKAAFDLDEL